MERKKGENIIMFRKFISIGLSLFMVMGLVSNYPVAAKEQASTRAISGVTSVEVDSKDKHIVWVTFADKTQAKLTFLDNNIFRYNVDPSGEFSNYAKVRKGYPDTAKIQQFPDTSDKYAHPAAAVTTANGGYEIKAGNVTVCFDKEAKMSIKANDKVVMQEKAPLAISSKTVQTLVKNTEAGEQFFGGGTQNGRFVHTGNTIKIKNESGWNDGQVSSPSPFYYTTNGYGVLRNTYMDGSYDFGNTDADTVAAIHDESEFDAYYFVSDKTDGRSVVQELLNGYFKVTGNPTLLPEYGFYLGHLNAYNRDAWSHEKIGNGWEIKGTRPHSEQGDITYERGGTGTVVEPGETAETLNGTGPTKFTQNIPEGVKYSEEFSAQGVLREYQKYDMPLGFFLPNDGYGAGYGQNGFNVTGGVNPDGSSSKERLEAVAANVENLRVFAEYAQSQGVASGLWAQSQIVPDSNPDSYWHLLRDFENEVRAGVTTLKTDVAWVGPGYSFQLSGAKQAYDIVTTVDYADGRDHTRPNIISLDGWAGSQRFNSVWTGDQVGGKWDYIRFHIPTFIGQGLAGNPNIGTDMDGIWGGNTIIATREYQWKAFAPQMLDMDGWGSYAKKPYTHGDPYTGIARMYLKLKSQMMPYIYTNAYAASNIDTGNNDTGLPMVRAMFLEYPGEAMAYGNAAKYQYMWGENLLVAPLYQDTDGDEDKDNDVRDGIYLPDANQVWIDYFTGEQYRGGQVLNGFDTPIWKLPVFVKNGAIIPMLEANNTPYQADKTTRLVEFWPAGDTDFTAIEDNGTFVENKQDKSDKEYGVINDVNYGPHVSTTYTSSVKGDVATLTANKATGSYKGYDQNKETTFIVHASKAPTSLVAKNGTATLKEVKVNSKADFDKAVAKAGTFVSFYDATPTIETYASAEEEIFAGLVKDVKVAGKLLVKFAETDSQANAQTLIINGFENDGKLNKQELNASLKAPTNFASVEEAKTPTSITLAWDAVEAATTYEILVDGTLENGKVATGTIHSIPGTFNEFTHTQLDFLSTHSYFIRSVNADGYSAWSEEVVATSADDPFINTPEPHKITWTGDLYGNHDATRAFNQFFEDGDGGFHSGSVAIGKHLTADYGYAHLFDYIEFYPRDDAGNGTPLEMYVETSLDGVNWVAHGTKLDNKGNKFFAFKRSAEMKHIELTNPAKDKDNEYIGARYIRFTPKKTLGNFFSASEIKPFAIKGDKNFGSKQKPFRVGNLLTQGTDMPSLDTFKSIFLKESSAHKNAAHPQWVGEMQDTFVDINFNGISDIWDYSFTGFNVEESGNAYAKILGSINWVPSATTIKKGEQFTVSLVAKNAANIAAFGGIINFNPEKVGYVGVEYCDPDLFTDGMTAVIKNPDGTQYINHNALFMGHSKTVGNTEGELVLSTITLVAKDNIALNSIANVNDPDFVMDLTNGMMIAPNHSFNKVGNKAVEKTSLSESDFNLTMTNEQLPTDDGTNVSKLIQDETYAGLFNGNKGDGAREFEFKWSPTKVVVLPTTLHMELKNAMFVNNVKVYNANKANGYLTSCKAKLIYEDGTESEETIIEDERKIYGFKYEYGKKVKQIDITFLSALKSDGTPVDNMLTLSEIEVFGVDKLDDTGVMKEKDFDLTVTNEYFPEDDGTNVNKLIQQGSYAGLFNGKPTDREFELKWDYEGNWVDGKLPENITTPLTLNMAFKEAKYVNRLSVFNSSTSGNGVIKDLEAVFTYEDGTTSDVLAMAGPLDVFTFKHDGASKKVTNIAINFKDSLPTKQNLTVGEIEVFASSKPIEEVVRPVDKSALEKLVVLAKDYDASQYSEESIATLENAIAEGNKVLANEAATQEEVDAACNAISDAYNNLAYRQADFTEVNKALEEAEKVEANKDIYTKESYDVFKQHYDYVAYLAKTGVPYFEQEKVDKAAAGLNKAMKALVVLPADYSKVDAAIKEANKLNPEDYKDFSGVQEAIDAVVRDLDITKQEEVDQMAMDIIEAIKGLEKKPEVKPTPDPKPENPDKPGTDDNTKPGNPDTDKDDTNVPPTGDTTNFGLLYLSLLAAGAAMVSLLRRKEN